MKKVWFVETLPLDEKNTQTPPIQGGGLCIHPSGLILTVAHAVTLPNLEQKDCLIQARAYEDVGDEDRTLELIACFPQFDVALCKVSKAEHQVFDFLPIPKGVQVYAGEDVFGYFHDNGVLFSQRCGYTSYDLPKNVFLHDMSDTTTMKSSGLLEQNPTIFLGIQQYRTVASPAGTSSDVKLHHLHPKLPLVEVRGFGFGTKESKAGSAGCPFHCPGCPLFKNGSGELVGLFTIQKNSFPPVNFLKKFVDYVLDDHNC